jgi:hypothetical protein
MPGPAKLQIPDPNVRAAVDDFEGATSDFIDDLRSWETGDGAGERAEESLEQAFRDAESCDELESG